MDFSPFSNIDVPSYLLDHNVNRCHADTPRSDRLYHRFHRHVRPSSLLLFFSLMVLDVVLTHERVNMAGSNLRRLKSLTNSTESDGGGSTHNL
jgi:hypothetical protein